MVRQGYAEARYMSPEDSLREYYIQLEIEAEITKAGLWNSGNVCFLNFHTDYQYFTAVIFASDFPGFPMSPEVFYRGKKVYIIDIIREYNGSPEIIVKTPDQIRIQLFSFISFLLFILL